MPFMMINGKMTEVPVGYNPLTDPSNPAYQPPGVVQAANAGPAGWGSRNIKAPPNPFGYEYDPTLQDEAWRQSKGIGRPQLDAWDAWTRQRTGVEPKYQGPMTGLVGQTYAAGGDVQGVVDASKSYTGGPPKPATAPTPSGASAPAPQPGVAPSQPPAPTPTAGGGLFTPRTPSGGLFTPQTQAAAAPLVGGTQGMAMPPPSGGLQASPYQGSSYVPPAKGTTGGMQPILPSGSNTAMMTIPQGGYQADTSVVNSAAQYPGRTAPISTGTRGVAAPTGGATAGVAGGLPPAPAGGYVPGLSVAQTGLIGNLTGRLEATQGASRFNNAQNWLQDMIYTQFPNRTAEQSLQLGNQAFGNSPETFALNDVLTKGIPGQFSIQDIAQQLMQGDGTNPLANQAQDVYSQLISGQLRPPGQESLESGTLDMFRRSPELMNAAMALFNLNPDVLNAAFGQIQGQGAGQNPNVENFINQTITGGIPGLSPVSKFASGQMQQGNPDLARVSQFAGRQMDEGLTGGYEEAFRRRYYEPAREQLLGDLSQRGVLDSGQRLKEESDLLQQNYLDSLLLQDMAARERGASLFGQTAESQQGTRERGAGMLSDTVLQDQAARERAAGLGQGSRGLNLEAARTTGGLSGLNLQAAQALLGGGQGAFGAGVGGYGAGNNLLLEILRQGTGAGGAAEDRALQRVGTGFSGIGQVNRDLQNYLGLAQQGTLGRAGLGLQGAEGEFSRALQTQMAKQGLLGDVAGRELQCESMNINALIDLINAQLAAQTGTEQAEATRRASRNQAIGSGIGSAAALLPLLLSSREFKQDIEPFEDKEGALERINQIPLKTWRFKPYVSDGGDKQHIGWINDEVGPEFVEREGMAIDLYSTLGHLVAAVQVLTEEIKELKKRVK